MDAAAFWAAFDVPKQLEDLANAELDIAEAKERAQKSRSGLGEQAKRFRADHPEAHAAASELLGAYASQLEASALRARLSEDAFFRIKKNLAAAPDPAPALAKASEASEAFFKLRGRGLEDVAALEAKLAASDEAAQSAHRRADAAERRLLAASEARERRDRGDADLGRDALDRALAAEKEAAGLRALLRAAQPPAAAAAQAPGGPSPEDVRDLERSLADAHARLKPASCGRDDVREMRNRHRHAW